MWSCACDQVMELVREPVAAVRGAVGGEPVNDRRLQLLFAFAGEEDETGDGDECAAEHLFIWILEDPGGVELRLGRQARLRRECPEDSRLREVRVGWCVRRSRRQEWASDLLHRFEVAALVRAPDLDHYGSTVLVHTAGFAQGGDHVVGEEEG